MLKFLLVVCIGCILAYAEPMKFVRVVDGDTIIFLDKNNAKIDCRIAYVDTPESVNNAKARKNAAKCNVPVSNIVSIGQLSKEYAHNFFLMHPTIDVVINNKDQYNRSVCVVQDYNLGLIRDGYANVYQSFTPKAVKAVYLPIQDQAKAAGVGLWAPNSKDLLQCLSNE